MPVKNIKGSARRKGEIVLSKDTANVALRNKGPEEIDQWIETNVTDLASAKRVLKMLAKRVLLRN